MKMSSAGDPQAARSRAASATSREFVGGAMCSTPSMMFTFASLIHDDKRADD
jgi:hypothetical protein